MVPVNNLKRIFNKVFEVEDISVLKVTDPSVTCMNPRL